MPDGGFVESFNGRTRTELTNVTMFGYGAYPRVVIVAWAISTTQSTQPWTAEPG